MRCLTAEEVVSMYGPVGFSVSDKHRWYRRELVLNSELASRQVRISASPPPILGTLAPFIQELNRWLPTERSRLFWVSHWELGNPHNSEALVRAARLGAGEPRSFDEAPGHYFDAHPYENLDVTETTPEHNYELGLLIGLVSMLLIESSDGWLLAEGCTDRVEFWEGNVLFHSEDRAKIVDADALLRRFDCPPNMR